MRNSGIYQSNPALHYPRTVGSVVADSLPDSYRLELVLQEALILLGLPSQGRAPPPKYWVRLDV